ncbi:MAG: ash family protein [[Actinobacillus] rossii]|nr:ash family protein [[Actinobacillus] rossii]
MNLNQIYYKKYENISQLKIFTKCGEISYSFSAVAKSTAERGNSNNEHMANSSTPLNRAFFVRSIRTPKENALSVVLSMVERIGQRLIVGCFPCVAVFHPDTFYRQAWKLAVVPEKYHMELLAMIYLFKAVNRSDLRNTAKHYSTFPKYIVRINADTLAQARAKIAPFFVVLGVVYA